MTQMYRRAVLAFAVTAIVLGFAVGALFVALGAARIYMLRKH